MTRILAVFVLAIAVSGCAIGGGSAPVYGCWCGENQPKTGQDPTPIDRWDRACRRHDLCYDRRGRNSRSCDRRLVRDIESIYRREGYIPGQMQAAHSYFGSRLRGQSYIQGFFTPRDIISFISSGKDCDN